MAALLLGSSQVLADSFPLLGAEAEYKLTLNYAAAMRTKQPDPSLIDGRVDPLESTGPVAASGKQPAQPATFGHTGLPITINYDDGDRNFKKYSLVHNRLSAFGEFNLIKDNYGLITSGDAFFDQAYRRQNDNTSPDTVNKDPPHNQFTSEARHYDGLRARILDAYGFIDLSFTDEINLNLRAGQQVVAWGESLFLRGIALSQGRADATRSSVAGAEIKELLLPTTQVGLQLSLPYSTTLLGYYHLEFKETELFPAGDFLSPADLIGPGGKFGYGSINPAAGQGCVGLLGDPFVESVICGNPDLNNAVLVPSGRTINVTRGEDIRPSKWGQWGVGLKHSITPLTTVGLFYLRYIDANPTVKLNPGFAPIGTLRNPVNGMPAGTVITTEVINQYVPTTYQVKYFGEIKLIGSSISTTVGPFNVGGEINYHKGIDTQVQAIISKVLSPVFTRADIGQVLVSAIYASNPKFYVDDIAVVAEAAYHHVYHVEAFQEEPGIIPVGDGKQLFGNRNAWGYQMLALGTRRNVFPGWDLKNQFSWGAAVKGNTSISGQFGPIFGEGDQRLGVGLGLQYLQNAEVGVSYAKFFGDAERTVRNSTTLFQNPYADRDFVSINFKYSL